MVVAIKRYAWLVTDMRLGRSCQAYAKELRTKKDWNNKECGKGNKQGSFCGVVEAWQSM